jgi:tetratricopeptide (TPR) repeat protein
VEPQSDPRRKNPRIKAPTNLLVGWKSPGYREVSHAETIALGGLFLHTSKPPAPGSVIELVFDLATGEIPQCVDMAPHEAKFRASLARSLGTVPQYRSEAIDHFQKAIELDPWTDSPYLQCAELYEQMQQLDLAAKLYSRLLAINPVHAKARARQAELISLSS